MFGNKSIIGLDIGSRVVKMAELKKVGDVCVLEKFGVEEVYPDGKKGQGDLNIKQAQIAAIKRMLQNAKYKPKKAVTAVSGESVIVRYIQLPEMPEEELKNALQWEAEEYIPFHIEDVNLDSVILGRVPDGSKIDVLLISAKKEIINNQVDILTESGLIPHAIDVDSFAFLNCYEYNYQPSKDEVTALINIGAEITSINIMMEGVSRFSRDISIAGDTITSSIQSKLGISFKDAEDLKIRIGAPVENLDSQGLDASGMPEIVDTIKSTVEKLTGDDLGDDSSEAIASKVIKNTLKNLANELQRSIQFFENQVNGKPVQKVFIGGGTTKLKNIDKFLFEQLNIPTEIIDPLRRIKKTGKDIDRNLLGNNGELLGTVIGLALRKVAD